MGDMECVCGCGTEIPASNMYVRGHHWRVKREAAGLPESKTCEGCGKTFFRTDVGQRLAHWAARRFCSNACRSMVRDEQKFCRGCDRWLPVSEFGARTHNSVGLHFRCRECVAASSRLAKPPTAERRKHYFLRGRYGITLDDYNAMLAQQGGVCAICQQPETAKRNNGETFALAVDHCHATKEIRGLLCGNCNKGIGGLRHDPRLLEAAMHYLKDTE